MKYRGKILITLSLLALLFTLSSSSILAQDSVEVRTKECYWSTPWYVGADTVLSVTAPSFQTRYNPILKVWVFNNQGKVDYVNSMQVHFEGSDLADVQEVLIYRESRGDTNYVFYPTSNKDTLFCGSGSFDLSGDVFFDFAPLYPVDSTRFEMLANDSILFYVVFVIPQGLPSTHTDNLLDCMIPQDAVGTQNGFFAPAANAGELRTYSVLVDADPPNLTEGDIYVEVESVAVKLGIEFTDSVVTLTDNVTGTIAQSTNDILVFTDIQSFNKGSDWESKRLTRIAATNDFSFSDSIWHEDKAGYGIDIDPNERLGGGGTPGSYIQHMTAWDEFGNSMDAWDLENPKPIDTIWPDSNLVEWILYYDANGDGMAALGDSIRVRIDMRNQAPAGEPDEILNKDVYHTLFPRNGLYFYDRYDFGGFDPSGIHYAYPLQFSDPAGDEIWDLYFEVMAGHWDVDSGDVSGYGYVTAEDNAQYWPNPPWPSINYWGPGNERRWQSSLFPFGVDNLGPVIADFNYDFAAGGDLTCLNIVNIGEVLFFVADLRGNLDSLTSVTIDLLTNGLGGPSDAPLYDDGTHGDVTAGDGYYSLEWTVPEPAPMWTWDTEDDGAHRCTLTVVDDAGNAVLDVAFIGKAVDTKLPYPVYNLTGQGLDGGRIQLDWDDTTAANDKGYYYIYWNNGTGGIGGIDTTSYYIQVASPTSIWTSDPLTHGASYCFLIRNVDDACNMEYNYYNMICITADAEPPTAEFVTPEDGDIFGPQVAPIQVVVRSEATDIDYFKIYYRQKDIDALTPGDQPGPWMFGIGIDNDGQYGTGSWDPTGSISDGEWEGVVCAEDEAGNEQTPSAAYALGQSVWIIWDSTPPTVFINSVNNDYNPAGVILENGVNNICVIGLDENWTDQMDVWMRLYDGTNYDTLFQGWQDAANMSSTSPYCFDFSMVGWQSETATLNIWIWDMAGNKGMATLTRPVEDIYPVVARMTRPVNFERVMWTPAYPVQAEFLAGSPVSEVVMVQFQEKLHTDGSWTTFCTQYTPAGSLFNCTWDNTAYEHGDQVDVRALFFDNAIPSNVETTAFVTATIDKEGPVIALEIKNAQLIGAVKYVAGDSLFLAARVLDTVTVDIKSVKFYKKKVSQPELYYELIGDGVAANNFTIFQLRKYIASWDTTYWHIKAVPFDASGNEGASVVDSFYYKKTKAPQVAIYKVKTDGMEWINPSGHLRSDGTGMDVFAQAYKPITAWHLLTTPADSGLVDNVAYSWAGWNLGNYGLNDSMTFNPLEEGIVSQTQLETSGYVKYKLGAVLTDIFGNVTYDSTFYLYILDVVGNQVVIINPDNHDYRKDKVTLQAGALHGYNLRSVTYYYRAPGAEEWIEIGTSTSGGSWTFYWYTRDNVEDGWYELTAKSEDLAGNPSDYGPIIKVFICNSAPRVAWVWDDQVPVIDGIRFVGEHMDIKHGWFPGWDPFDVILKAYANKAHTDAAGIDYVWWEQKDYTSGSFSQWSLDQWVERFGDSLYARPGNVDWSDGWRHGRAGAEDSSGNDGYSDTVLFYVDTYDPYGRVVAVNSDPAPWMKDLAGPPYEDTIWARAWDEYGSDGERSGVDSLQFMIYNYNNETVFFGSVYEPDSSTEYPFIWNTAGLDTGTYTFYLRVVDKVHNVYEDWLGSVRVEDHRPRIATVRAFHDDMLIYASVDRLGANSVTFQYLSLASSEWVNVGMAEAVNPENFTWGGITYKTDILWYTYWDPSSLPAGDYLVRCLAHGPWEYWFTKPLAKPMDAEVGPPVRFHVDADGNVEPVETEDIGAISFRAVLETGTKGVVKVEAQRTPYLLAVYSHGAVEVERISLSKETGTNIYNGTFEIPWSSSTGGDVRFYASVVPDTTYIEMGGFDIDVVDQYLGTNGPVEFVDGSASIDIPGGAIHVSELNLVGYPTMMPPVVANECKKFTPVGNADELIWKFYLFGFSADANLYDFAKITLYYDETQATIPESQLQVARWDYEDYCWYFDDIETPTVDEANNSITFFTKTLGTFAVIETALPMWATVEVDPNCSDYTNSMPCLIAYIHSDYADIDAYSIKMKLGPVGGIMKTIYFDNTFADGYCSPFAIWDYEYYGGKCYWFCEGSGWDYTSGELDVCIMEEIKALAAGDYIIMVEAYDQVGNFASAVDTFTVDTKVPKITFLNGYVSKNPEFSFTIEDAESGVDTNTIYIDMYSVTKLRNESGSWVEYRRYLGTYSPAQIDIVSNVVDITTTLELVNNQAFDVVIYDGTYENSGDPAEQDDMRIYHPKHGPGDCVGNQTDPVYQRFAIDDKGPSVSLLTSKDARPIVIKVEDDAGVDWTTFALMEDGSEVTDEDRLIIDQATGTAKYTPAGVGLGVVVSVEDVLANRTDYSFASEAEELAITKAHNYPNPFDDCTKILFKLSRAADVVIKIYDFGGELVNTVVPGDWMNAGDSPDISWCATNEDGEEIANGIYLCHIKANDGSHTASEVIKIAVVRKD